MKPIIPPLLKRPGPIRPKKLLRKKYLLPLAMILIISITTTFAQESTNHIYLSGQITNIENGAPVAGHPVYIESNSESPGGLNYYLAAYTDAYGFFNDTITTAALDGKLVIYTYDVFEEEYERVEFFRFNWYSEYHMEAGLEIVDPNTMTDFQANFETHKDSISHDSLSVFFEDISLGEDIVSWYWDFGDGSSALGPVSHHIYNEPGIYDVSLTVSTEPLVNDFRTSTIVKKVYAGMREYFDFGGHAFAGYFPVDIGTAYLYKIEEDEFIPIDTTQFDTLGFYYFPTLIEGDYKVKAFPSTESVNAGKYLPTYFENALLWTKAKIIKLDENGWEYDIHMVENFEYGTGAGAIDGMVALDGGKTFNMNDVEVILFNEDNQCLTYINSDEEGAFEFVQLAYGTYQVMAEVPGMYTYPTSITISEENPVIEDISILVYDEEIPHGIADDVDKLAGLGNLYPNPARDHVILPFELKENRQLQFFVINQGGQVIEKSTGFYHAGDHQVQINTAALLPGMYRIMVLAGNEKHIRAFVKAH